MAWWPARSADLHERRSDGTLAGLREAHHRKTGVLFMAAVSLGGPARAGPASSEQLALERFAAELGLAFQARDDVIRRRRDGGPAGGDPAADPDLAAGP